MRSPYLAKWLDQDERRLLAMDFFDENERFLSLADRLFENKRYPCAVEKLDEKKCKVSHHSTTGDRPSDISGHFALV